MPRLQASRVGTQADIIVGGFVPGDGMATLKLDMRSGQLELVAGSAASGAAPAFFAWDAADTRTVFTTNHLRGDAGTGATAVRVRRGLDGALALSTAAFRGGPDATHLALSPSGRWLVMAASTGTNWTVVAMAVAPGPNGAAGLGPPSELVPPAQLPVQSNSGTHQVLFRPDPAARGGRATSLLYVVWHKPSVVRMFR